MLTSDEIQVVRDKYHEVCGYIDHRLEQLHNEVKNMDSVVTPTAFTPGIVSAPSFPGPYGPAYSTVSPADAAHLSVAATERNWLATQFGDNFTRDAIERQVGFSEIRALINSVNAAYGGLAVSVAELKSAQAVQNAELKAALSSQENTRLRDDLSNTKQQAMLDAILAAITKKA